MINRLRQRYSGEPDLIAGEFDSLSDDEVAYILNSQPELMGRGRIRKWFKRRRKRAKKVFKKLKKAVKRVRKKIHKVKKRIVKKLKKAPKGLKVLGALALGPLAPRLAAKAGIAMAIKKRRQKMKKLTPAQRAALKKKRRKGLAIAASFLIPGAAAKIGAGVAAKKIIKRRRLRKAASLRRPVRRITKQAAAQQQQERYEEQEPITAVVPSPVAEQIRDGQSSAAAIQQPEFDEETGEQKKSGVGALLLPAAALALPFLL
jgi:hypothetical protein